MDVMWAAEKAGYWADWREFLSAGSMAQNWVDRRVVYSAVQ